MISVSTALAFAVMAQQSGPDCICLLNITQTVKYHRRAHDLVVLATVESVGETRSLPAMEGRPFEQLFRQVTLQVSLSWKGSRVRTLVVENSVDPRACMAPHLAVGEQYLVFADSSVDGWIVGHCNPSIPSARGREWIQALGRPKWRAQRASR